MQPAAPIDSLRLEAVTKRFPGVLACDRVDLEIGSGEALALVGENGAGKTTLMNILAGLYSPDEGRILVNGREVRFRSPRDSHALGIGMVHQHFMLVPSLTVAENILLGLRGMHRLAWLDTKGAKRLIAEVAERYGLPVQPDLPVWQLSVGEQQRVELVKTLCLGARLLILDEPTAALTPQETDDLIGLLKRMKRELSIIFISHKLQEVKSLADRVAILRHGAVVHRGGIGEHSAAELAALMTGHAVELPRNASGAAPGDKRLSLWNLRVLSDRGHAAVDGLDLDVRAGEIVGLAGVSGNGQRELADALAGLRPVQDGNIHLDGVRLNGSPPRRMIAQGMGYVPEDRHNEGIVPSFSIRENLMLKDFSGPAFSAGGFLRLRASERNAEDLRRRFDIRSPSTATAAGGLSGGNIQKVILARELARGPKALVAVYPTRGLDLGAIEFIHKRLLELRAAGVAILLISEELEELINLSDRIGVIYKGKVVKVLPAARASRERLGMLMAGLADQEVGA